MKYFKNLLNGLFILSAFTLVLTSCSDESDAPGEEDKAFVGKWESRIYTSLSATTGFPISEQMIFTFTNDGFTDRVYQGAVEATTHDELAEAVAMKGVIDATDAKLTAEITDISLQGGPFTNKTSDEATFYAYFNATIGKMLDEKFVADYVIEGTTMTFTLPVKIGGTESIQSLILTKVE